MNRKWTYYLVAATLLLLVSCRKDASEPIDFGYSYFPTQVGTWITYDVTEIEHDTAAVVRHDTANYQIMEVIESSFLDLEGRETQRIERYKRDSISGPWIIKDVWYSTLTAVRAEKVEENERFIKLIFPPKVGKAWNGNAFNTMNEWDYVYSATHDPVTLGSLSFDSTTTVLQRENHNLVEYEQAEEVYANGVGLVYKRFKDLTIFNFDTLQINYGTELIQTVSDYGN